MPPSDTTQGSSETGVPAGARCLVIVPAFNEELSVGELVREVDRELPGLDVLVIDDGSRDRTSDAAGAAGANVLRLPCNLGVGGAVQAGLAYALSRGYDLAVRIDGDGQHPPAGIPAVLRALSRTGADMAVGSRFLGNGEYRNSIIRSLGIRYLSAFLSLICRQRVTDPTSGFHAFTRPLIEYFANEYPSDFPEPESLALLRRQGYAFTEAGVTFRPRRRGVSSIGAPGSLYYALKVTVALLADRARTVNPRFARRRPGGAR